MHAGNHALHGALHRAHTDNKAGILPQKDMVLEENRLSWDKVDRQGRNQFPFQMIRITGIGLGNLSVTASRSFHGISLTSISFVILKK